MNLKFIFCVSNFDFRSNDVDMYIDQLNLATSGVNVPGELESVGVGVQGKENKRLTLTLMIDDLNCLEHNR